MTPPAGRTRRIRLVRGKDETCPVSTGGAGGGGCLPRGPRLAPFRLLLLAAALSLVARRMPLASRPRLPGCRAGLGRLARGRCLARSCNRMLLPCAVCRGGVSLCAKTTFCWRERVGQRRKRAATLQLVPARRIRTVCRGAGGARLVEQSKDAPVPAPPPLYDSGPLSLSLFPSMRTMSAWSCTAAPPSPDAPCLSPASVESPALSGERAGIGDTFCSSLRSPLWEATSSWPARPGGKAARAPAPPTARLAASPSRGEASRSSGRGSGASSPKAAPS